MQNRVALAIIITLALGAGAGQAEESGKAKDYWDFTVPSFGSKPTGPCAEQRVMPDWFTENDPTVPMKWQQKLRERLYKLRRYQLVIETGRCDCDTQYPDPGLWRDEIDALVARYTDENGRLREHNGEYYIREASRLLDQSNALYGAFRETCGW